MLKSVIIILVFILISFFHIPQLVKEKQVKEIWFFSILMLFATVVAIAQVHDATIPNPLELITIAVEPINQLFK